MTSNSASHTRWSVLSEGTDQGVMAEERMDCDSGSPEPETNQSDKYRQRGNEAYKSGDYQQARDLYSSAIQLDPQNATLYGNRSASYMMLQDFSAALEDSTRSVHLDESYTKVSGTHFVVRIDCH